MIVEKAWEHYKLNLKASLAFALLLVFVPAFSLFESVFTSSGSMFVDYSISSIIQSLPFIPLLAVFLLFYSLLISAVIFSVRKGFSKLKLQFYLKEMIQKFALKVFAFFAVFSFVIYVSTIAMALYGVNILVIALFLFLVSLATMFVPQSLVIDEDDLLHAVMSSIEFISKNPKGTSLVLVVGAAWLAIVTVVGHAIDLFFFAGAYVSLLLTLVFVLPFMEIMKSYIYMLKFDLIKSPQLAGQQKKRVFEESKDLTEAAKKKIS